jgi:hypothetical protein
MGHAVRPARKLRVRTFPAHFRRRCACCALREPSRRRAGHSGSLARPGIRPTRPLNQSPAPSIRTRSQVAATGLSSRSSRRTASEQPMHLDRYQGRLSREGGAKRFGQFRRIGAPSDFELLRSEFAPRDHERQEQLCQIVSDRYRRQQSEVTNPKRWSALRWRRKLPNFMNSTGFRFSTANCQRDAHLSSITISNSPDLGSNRCPTRISYRPSSGSLPLNITPPGPPSA